MSRETKDTLIAFIVMGVLCGAFAAGLLYMAQAIGSYIEHNYNPHIDCMRMFDPGICD